MRRPVLQLAVVLPLCVLGCSSERAPDTRPRTSGEAPVASCESAGRDHVLESAGRWTSTCSAQWLRQIVRDAGHRVTGATGSAWVAAGRRTSFYTWATDASASPRELANRGSYRLVSRVANAPVYDDGVRKFWPARRFIVWVEAGPGQDSTALAAREFAPLVRASRDSRPTVKPVRSRKRDLEAACG